MLVWVAASTGSRADGESNVWPSTRPFGSVWLSLEDLDKLAAEAVDKAIGMLSGEERMDLSVLRWAEYRLKMVSDLASHSPEWRGKSREEIVRGHLGEERCLALEQACLAALETGDEGVRMGVRDVLAGGLGSRVLEEAWVRQLRETSADSGETGVPETALDEYFSLAKTLASLGNNAGREALLDVLRAERPTVPLLDRAFRAMQAADEPIPDDILDPLLRSSDAPVAQAAFRHASKDGTNPLSAKAAGAQLERLDEKHRREGRLVWDDASLLWEVAGVCKRSLSEGTFPEDAKASAKAVARYFVQCGNPTLAKPAAALFIDLAGEEDEEVIASILASDVSMIRSSGLVGLSKCPVEVLERHLDRLRELQDDADFQTRLYVAKCLQKLVDAGKIPADSFVSPEEIFRRGPSLQ